MILMDVGGYKYDQNEAVATLSASPLGDRALLTRRINLSNESANDTWDVTVGGRILMSFRHLTTGNQRLLHVAPAGSTPRLDFWEFCRDRLGIDASIPVPNGQSLTIASRGGATADIDIESWETDIAQGNAKGLQHYQGNVFLMPIYWSLAASQAAAGSIQFDTQFAPAWIPPLHSNTQLPTAWKIELLALFVEGAGVNTFSGAANHQSTTRDNRITRNGVQMFTRASLGFPNRGSDSAAGSANTVLGQRSGIFTPFEAALNGTDPVLPVPLVLNGGDVTQMFLDITGDLTGGALYGNALMCAIARVTVPSS